MISKNQNVAMVTVGKLAMENPAWVDYANYCFAREQGVRKQAFQYLVKFIAIAESWSFADKVAFLQFLFPLFESVRDATHGIFPHQLREYLARPILEQWCARDASDSSPFRWYGTYYWKEEYLLKALEINPKDDKARQTLISRWVYHIYFAVHHLPEGYIGDPVDDLAFGEEVKEQIGQLSTQELRDHWLKKFENNLELVQNYVQWQESGHPDLAQWGQENHKRVIYEGGGTYYYEK